MASEPSPELHLHEAALSSEPARRQAPAFPPLTFSYSSAPDRDTNLLILLHGLGDTAAPFASLAKSLNLPQTATLSLQGPQRVPLLEEEAYQWWPSFDELGERKSPAALSKVFHADGDPRCSHRKPESDCDALEARRASDAPYRAKPSRSRLGPIFDPPVRLRPRRLVRGGARARLVARPPTDRKSVV